VGLADNRQYLRIGLMGADYLLPGSSGFAIEKRADLEEGNPGSIIAAMRVLPNGSRVPAYALDGGLHPFPRDGWQRAVFIQGLPAAGLITEEVELMSAAEVRIEKFRPLGPAPTRIGHLFDGAWVRTGNAPLLLFEPRALLMYMSQFRSAS